jgi:hypothetical protein
VPVLQIFYLNQISRNIMNRSTFFPQDMK